jgi:uncharacterized protein YjbI with pentapeptide repeats
LDDLAIRWETPRGREIKGEVLQDLKHNRGERLQEILNGFIYTSEIQDGRDLRCITLEDMDLSDTTWRKCDLSWASFKGTQLVRADFRDANLKRANLVESNLTLARFAEADCARTDFSRANLEHANFKEAKLNGAVFVGANCSRCSFDTAILTKCNFVNARLEQANFSNADCSNGNFSGSGLDQTAAKPLKTWGIRFDMPLEEFERQVGLNSLTSRTTKKFKGLDVLLKASSALAKIQKKTGAFPSAPDEVALGAPPGMRRLETFKRPAEDATVFGAGLRKRTDGLSNSQTGEEVSAQDYLEEATQSYDPDERKAQTVATQDLETVPVETTFPSASEALADAWPDGGVEAAPAEAASAGPPTAPSPQRPASARIPPKAPGAAGAPPAPGAPRPPMRMTATSSTRSTLPPALREAKPGEPGAAPPSPTASARTTRPLGAPPGPAGPPTGRLTPPPTGVPRPPTVRPGPPVAGAAPKTPATGVRPAAPLPGAPTPAPPAAPGEAPSFVAPLDRAAPAPTSDWAKAIGQLMQSKSSITKIVIELGDRSRVVFKKS